ncbi:MAG: type II toxin-antitoxin system RelE/ParE family toxin [Gammaproteobacteria bacterium]|nr:type II toxin-antitoxin system RelE/ParE family toxin [Gammaproteobacteria bacterium]
MNVVWALEAQRDRAEIFEFIASGDPLDAARVDERFSAAAQRLAYQPIKGRAGRVVATREYLAHEHYRLVYETRDDEVRILAVTHVTRQWPPVRGA